MNSFRYGVLLLTLALSQISIASEPPTLASLRVQLMGPAQMQYAGFYLADMRNLFESNGVEVELIPGDPSINPIRVIQEGKADIAVSWLSLAQEYTTPAQGVTNIAQLFIVPSLRLICKTDRKVFQPKDLAGKTIGVGSQGEFHFIQYFLEKNKIPLEEVRIKNNADAQFLSKESALDCDIVSSYSNYLPLLKENLHTNSLIELYPGHMNLPHFEDGLYVLTSRLDSPEFKKTLVHFLTALRQGWAEARHSPALAVEVILQQNPTLPRTDQQFMLEQVLQLIPKDQNQFGLFNIRQFHMLPNSNDSLWTHQIWNQLDGAIAKHALATNTTSYYMKLVTDNFYYKLLIYFGVFTFALSGILEAINREYDLYGRLVLGLLSGLGGGTIRDLLIQGERFPFYYIKDLTYPLGILSLVVGMAIITAIYPTIHHTALFKEIKKYTDVIGFSVLAMTGAVISLSAGLPWFWAPFFAALSCSGGGILRDIVINQEPSAFKKTIYEEPAVVGALILIGGLYVSNLYEHSAMPVITSIIGSIILVIAMRLVIYRFNLQYPKWLGGTANQSH